jgi:hypothetical protein
MTTTTRPLYEIAKDIVADLNEQYPYTGKPRPSWLSYAGPYIVAMAQLESIDEDYGADSGKSVVLYALSNLSYWRGDTARAVKAELKSIAGIK